MRPQILYPLFAPVTSLAGVGPRLKKLYERLAGGSVVGLLWHLPSGLIDRRYAPKIRDAQEGKIATLTLWIDGHEPPGNPRLPYRVRCRDETGFLFLVFFHARSDYLEKVLPVGAERVVSGRLERFRDRLQITHPDHIGTLAELESLKRVRAGLSAHGGAHPQDGGEDRARRARTRAGAARVDRPRLPRAPRLGGLARLAHEGPCA